jgi:hypothetical protein
MYTNQLKRYCLSFLMMFIIDVLFLTLTDYRQTLFLILSYLTWGGSAYFLGRWLTVREIKV